jgi:hypothetical protein
VRQGDADRRRRGDQEGGGRAAAHLARLRVTPLQIVAEPGSELEREGSTTHVKDGEVVDAGVRRDRAN